MTIDLLRHGEPIGGRMYRCNQDDPLSKKGWNEMLSSTQGKHWDYIASSALTRCSDFAKYLAEEQNIKLDLFDEFIELGFGDWQGKTAEEIGQTKVDLFKSDPLNHRPNNAENLLDFQHRVLSRFNHIINNSQTKNILIIAHAGVIRVIKSHLFDLELEKMFTIEVMSGSCERFEI